MLILLPLLVVLSLALSGGYWGGGHFGDVYFSRQYFSDDVPGDPILRRFRNRAFFVIYNWGRSYVDKD